MRYVLRKWVFGQVPQIEITAEEYAKFKAARGVLSSAFAIEENYELLIANYQEFEATILESAATDMIRSQVGYEDFFDIRIVLNRRLINLCTTTRLYLDQLLSHVRTCASDPKEATARVDATISEQYDAHREYRFMDSFRNYVQHQGIPIHWISHAGVWTMTEAGEKELMQFSIELVAEASILRRDGGLKARPLSELEEKVDLTLYVRRYIECLSAIQDVARQVTAEAASEARALMESAHKRYLDAGSESVIGLDASIVEDERDVVIESTSLFLDRDDIRASLLKRNRKLVNLHRRFVTSESTFAQKAKKKS